MSNCGTPTVAITRLQMIWCDRIFEPLNQHKRPEVCNLRCFCLCMQQSLCLCSADMINASVAAGDKIDVY